MRWVGCLAVLQASGAGALLVSPTTPPAHSAPRCTPTGKQAIGGTVIALNKATVNVMKGAIDVIYAGRDFQRFYVLETIARVPYFSYLSCLHLYESLGLRAKVHIMRTHYAEADNELHHLLIMEELGGSDEFADRFVAQHLAFFYFWYCIAIYVLHPRAAYHLSELVEEHAFLTYDAFLHANEEELRAQPVPEAARQYYGGRDPIESFLRAGEDASGGGRNRQPRPLRSLYDVFLEVRDDEAAHWRTLCNLVQYDELDAPDGCEVASTEVRSNVVQYDNIVQHNVVQYDTLDTPDGCDVASIEARNNFLHYDDGQSYDDSRAAPDECRVISTETRL